MYLQKVKAKKLEKKNYFFVGVFKVTSEKSRIRSRYGTDPRIRIRTVQKKMSRIQNIDRKNRQSSSRHLP